MKPSFTVALTLPLLMSCASYKDRVPVRTEIFPAVHLASLQGQSVSLSVFEYHRSETELTRILYDDLERELTRAGVKVVASAPMQLRVQIDYLTADFRQGRWESCGHLTGTLVRNEQNVVVQSIVSSYCTNETVNPWQVADTNRARVNAADANGRTYYGLVREFLVKLEKVTKT